MIRGGRTWIAVGVVLVVIAPALHPSQSDGFPLSTYPMFGSDRGRESVVATVVGVDEEGTVDRLGPRTIAGSDEVLQAAASVRRAVATDRGARLCEQVAGRLPGRGLSSVEVRTERFDHVAYFEGDTEPVSVRVHHRCEVADP